MKSENKKLVFVFVTLLIIISASFIITNQFYEVKFVTKEDEKEISPLDVVIIADKTSEVAPHEVNLYLLI